MKLPQKTLEHKLIRKGYCQVVGVDEVGMGCLAGPVVVCAVMLDRQFFAQRYPKLAGIRDSKLLNARQRETLVQELLKIENLKFKICYAYPKTIDRLNIYQASRAAMRRAVKKLVFSCQLSASSFKNLKPVSCKLKAVILVDGNKKIPKLDLPQLTITGGDRKVFSIACASIIAKVYRDHMMTRYARKYPDYGFEKHKGYGTKLHQIALTTFGPIPIHRKSFRLEY